MGNDGASVDGFYQELASRYPQYFDSDVTNPADQLQAIAEWRNETADKLLEPASENIEMEEKENGRSEENGQEISTEYEGENRARERINEENTGSTEKKLSEGLSNYEGERRSRLGSDFKATVTPKENYGKHENVVATGFKEVTGLDITVYETSKPTTEGAFYSDDGIFLKHSTLENKKLTNFRPYHELGHWLEVHNQQEWQQVYDAIDNTITDEQIKDYKNVLNDKSQFDNKSESEVRDMVIKEIESDYFGNWANNVENWYPYIEQKKISDEYAEFLADISFENKEFGYNVFGTLEQQDAVYSQITDIMANIIGENKKAAKMDSHANEGDDLPFSDRDDIDEKYNNYTDNEIERFKSSKTIKIANNKSDVIDFIENAKKASSNLKLYFGKIDVATADNIKRLLGIDVNNYNISLKNNNIKKVFKDHGTAETELPRGQVPITDEDFLNIPDIINNPDTIESVGETEKGKPVIKFEKNIDGNNVVITYVSDKHHNLDMQTMYKFKNKKNRVSSTVIYGNNSPSLNTSRTGSGTKSLITNSISQSRHNVNTQNTVRNSNTQQSQNNTGKVQKSDRTDTDENGEGGFYSQLENVIEQKMPKTASAEQIQNIINSGGVKADELGKRKRVDYEQRTPIVLSGSINYSIIV